MVPLLHKPIVGQIVLGCVLVLAGFVAWKWVFHGSEDDPLWIHLKLFGREATYESALYTQFVLDEAVDLQASVGVADAARTGRFAPIADQIPHRSETTLSARSGHATTIKHDRD
jgi:hypothetical protein